MGVQTSGAALVFRLERGIDPQGIVRRPFPLAVQLLSHTVNTQAGKQGAICLSGYVMQGGIVEGAISMGDECQGVFNAGNVYDVGFTGLFEFQEKCHYSIPCLAEPRYEAPC